MKLSQVIIFSIFLSVSVTAVQASLEYSGDNNIMRGNLRLENELQIFNGDLTVNGNIIMTDGNQAAGKVLISDANGKASWVDVADSGALKSLADDASPMLGADLDTNGHSIVSSAGRDLAINADGDFKVNNDELVVDAASANVGVGTANPSAKLDVAGDIKCSGAISSATTSTNSLQVITGAGTGKVLTSDAAGNAVWQNPVSNKFISTATSTLSDLTDEASINTTVNSIPVTEAEINNIQPNLVFDFISLANGDALLRRANSDAIEIEDSGVQDVLIPNTNLKVVFFDGTTLTIKKNSDTGFNSLEQDINVDFYGVY